MNKFLQIAILLLASLIIMSGCSQSSNTPFQNSIISQNSSTDKKTEALKYAQSPRELIENYFKAVNNRDEKAGMSCMGIVWDDQLAGFWHNEEANEYEGGTITPINIVYKNNPDPNFDAMSAIKTWITKAANNGMKLAYTFDEIKSYGVVYCSLSMNYNGESGIHEDSTFDVIETDKGWFMVSIDTAR